MKTISVYPKNIKLHNLYNPMFDYLSKEYNLIYNPQENKYVTISDGIKKYPLLRLLYYKTIRPFFSLNNFKTLITKKDKIPKGDLLFCSSSIPNTKKDYIISFGIVTCFGGFDYNRLNIKELEKQFSSKNCKAILCWYNVTKKSIEAVMNTDKFKDKIYVLPFSRTSHKIRKVYHNKNNIQLLFVSSINYPLDFDLKGGIIALEAFKKLQEIYPNIKFIVKANVPEKIKQKYNHLNITFIEKKLEEEELAKLLLSSDIILEPVAGTNLILEAMDYKIPVVAFNLWEIPEMTNGFGGTLVDCSSLFGSEDDFKSFVKNNQSNYLKLHSRKVDEDIVNEFVEQTRRLIENKQRRKEIGEYLKARLEQGGRYYIGNMKRNLNKVIKKVL